MDAAFAQKNNKVSIKRELFGILSKIYKRILLWYVTIDKNLDISLYSRVKSAVSLVNNNGRSASKA